MKGYRTFSILFIRTHRTHDEHMQKAGEKTKKNRTGEVTASSLPVPATSLERYLAEISQYPVLSREEELELARRYREEGDLEAARKLITSNLRFVVKIASEYKNYGLNPMDIIQEGNIGLMHAVKRFDPTKGYRLISYAVWWIRAYIQNYIIRSWSLVKIGTTQEQRKLFYKLRSKKRDLSLAGVMLDERDYDRLARELGVSAEAVEEMEQRMSSKDLSLDAALNEDVTHLEFLEEEGMDQEEIVARAEEESLLRKGLQSALGKLKDRERYILKHRVLSDNPMTLEELGQKLNLSRERVRQIESGALRKVRSELEKGGFT